MPLTLGDELVGFFDEEMERLSVPPEELLCEVGHELRAPPPAEFLQATLAEDDEGLGDGVEREREIGRYV